MRLLRLWDAVIRHGVSAMVAATDPGEDRSGNEVAPAQDERVLVSVNDMLWYKSSQDEEGRITVGILACPLGGLGVLVDDNGQSLGLRLSHSEAQDLHRSLVRWLADTARPLAF